MKDTTFKILEEVTIKFILTGIIENRDKIKSVLGLDGYCLSINICRNQNITEVIATKRDDNIISIIM